jgi:MFS family permease
MFIGLLALAIVSVLWNALAKTAGPGRSYIILGTITVSSGLLLSLFGTFLPKHGIRNRIFVMCAIPCAHAGMGCLLLGLAPSEAQQKWNWILMLSGLGSFAGLQVLLAYLLVKVLRGPQ